MNDDREHAWMYRIFEKADERYAKIIYEKGFIAVVSAAGIILVAFALRKIGIV